MITHLNGQLVEKNPGFIVVECNGVGYYAAISLTTFSALKDNGICKVYIHHHITEMGQSLFAFATKAERETFRSLISVSGIGTSTAMVVLSSLAPIQFQQAIAEGNINVLKSIKGIGLKSAQRIIVDLAGKLGKTEGLEDFFPGKDNTILQDALSALVGLGFDKTKAGKVIESLIRDNTSLKVEEIVKAALKKL